MMLAFKDQHTHPLLNHQKSTHINGFRNVLLILGCVLFAGAAIFNLSERSQTEQKLGVHEPLPAPRLAVATESTASGSQSIPVVNGGPLVPGRDDRLRSVEVSPEVARLPPPYSFSPSIPYGTGDLAKVPPTKTQPKLVGVKGKKKPPAGLPPGEPLKPVTIKVDYVDELLQKQEELRQHQQKAAMTGPAVPKPVRNPLDIPGMRDGPAFDPLPLVGLSPGNNIEPIVDPAPF